MTHTPNTLLRRLAQGGFKTEFVREAILPDWWEPSCADDLGLLPDLEIRIARFLGLSVALVRDPQVALRSPNYANAQLRHVRNIERNRLTVSIHAALEIAGAVVRNLRPPAAAVCVPPDDALVWRSQLRLDGCAPGLLETLQDLWARGIPVVQVEILPHPTFQGLACILDNRPVIALGRNHDEPSRIAFVIAHEVGHVANSDCMADQPVVDEQEDVQDDDQMELRADRYAQAFLTGGANIPEIEADSFIELAERASELEPEMQVDAGTIVWNWANQTRDFQTAAMALKALYRAQGGRRLVRRFFDENVDLDSAPESDRALLRCVYGEPTRNAASH